MLETATPSLAPEVVHPYVSRATDVQGGRPCIVGTRFPVKSVVVYLLRFGLAPEELVEEFPELTLAQVHDALSYYYDHKDELETDLAEDRRLAEEHERSHR